MGFKFSELGCARVLRCLLKVSHAVILMGFSGFVQGSLQGCYEGLPS